MRLFIAVVSLLVSAVTAEDNPTEQEKLIWHSVGSFGHALTKAVVAAKPNENVLLSPLSVHSALSMAWLGAGDETKQQMTQTMALAGIDLETFSKGFTGLMSRKHENETSKLGFTDRNFNMNVANRLYVSKKDKIESRYVGNVAEIFKADAKNVDFANDGQNVLKEINDFVDQKTHGLIKEVLTQELSRDTLIAIVNTVYFKGLWSKKMSEHRVSRVFNKGCNGLEIQHPIWLNVTSRMRYLESDVLKAKMVQIPYSSGEVKASMLIILPIEEHSCDANKWLKTFDWNKIKQECNKMNYEDIRLSMPRFEVEYSQNLKDILPGMGMPIPFTPAANFKGIADGSLSISDVIHKTKMIVTKFGTEASAATVISLTKLALIPSPNPIPLSIDRSFYAAIIYHNDDNSFMPIFTSVINKV